jgi:hypothetical protein
MARFRIPLLLLFAAILATSQAYAQRRPVVQRPVDPGLPRISSEYPVADVLYGPTNTRNVQPAVAAGPDQSLVVWSGPSYTEAARVDASGRVLDKTPLVLPGQPLYPSGVIWDGRHYLVVTASASESVWIVRLVGVSTEGRIDLTAEVARVSEEVVDLSIARQASGELAIACATRPPGGYGRGILDLTLFMVGSDGRFMQSLSLGTMTGGAETVRLAASPTAYLAVWGGGAALVGDHGATMKLLPLPPYTTADATWNGTDFTIVTADATAVRMFHLLGSGEITPSTIVHSSPSLAWFPALAWNGTEYRVLWKELGTTSVSYGHSSYDLHAARVAPSGVVLDDRVLSISTDDNSRYLDVIDRPAVAAQDSGWLLAWTRLTNQPPVGTGDAYVLKLSTEEEPSVGDVVARQQLLSGRALWESAPALTVTSGAARVIWSEGTQTRTAAIDPAGHRSADSSVPAGDSVLVAGSDSGTVIVSRELDPPHRFMGVLIGHEGIAGTQFPIVSSLPSDTYVNQIALACGTNDCAVAYRTIVGSAADTMTHHFQRFTPAGTMIDAQPIDIPAGLVGLSARGDEYLMAFWSPTNELVVSRFATGKLSDVTRLAAGMLNAPSFAVASNSTGWFVAWMDYTATGLRRISAFRVAADGGLQGETDLVFPAGAILNNMSATWDGRDWLVAWSQTGLLSDVYAARVAPDGTLLDFRNGSPGFGVAATVNGEYTPVIGSAADGLTAVAYVRAPTEQRYGETSRVFVRWIDNR